MGDSTLKMTFYIKLESIKLVHDRFLTRYPGSPPNRIVEPSFKEFNALLGVFLSQLI